MGRRGKKHHPLTHPQAPPVVRQVTTTSQLIHAEYSGPLPPARQLELYEQLLPGAADRIVHQWELQTDHRRDLEQRVVQNNIEASRRGQWFSLIITLVAFGLGGWLFAQGLEGWAFAVVFSDLLAVVAVNRGTYRRQQEERDKKSQK